MTARHKYSTYASVEYICMDVYRIKRFTNIIFIYLFIVDYVQIEDYVMCVPGILGTDAIIHTIIRAVMAFGRTSSSINE